MTFELPYTKPVFKHQPDATIDQDNPVSGQKYEWKDKDGNPLGTQKNVRLVGVAVRCTWTEQPTSIEAHITINDVPHKYYFNDPVSDQWYCTRAHYLPNAETNQLLETIPQLYYTLALFESRNVKVEAEITGGTVSNLSARVKWAKME